MRDIVGEAYVVVVFEPRRPGEPGLTLADQVHQVVGPFGDEEEALEWVQRFMDQGSVEAEHVSAPSRFTFYVTDILPSAELVNPAERG